jgi:regulatory protein
VKITKIEAQKRNPRRLSIYLDGRFALGLDAQVVQDMGLHQGLEISRTQLGKVFSAEEKNKAKNFALDFIGYRARSVREVAQRLEKRGHSGKIIDQVIRELRRNDLLDDVLFAAQWAQHRMATKPMGEYLLRQELKLKGISDEIVEKTLLTTFGQTSQRELATELLRARWVRYRSLDVGKARRRMADFLLRRGFPREIVWEVVAQTLEAHDGD